MRSRTLGMPLLALAAMGLMACAPGETASVETTAPAMTTAAESAKFERDRQSILAMAGEYRVRFHFIETVPFTEGYEPKDIKESGGNEVVRVIEDRGDFISLQHILVVGSDHGEMVVKHWRQDWQYEPERVFEFVGGNAWRMRETDPADVDGKWSQSVYQVDDAPRYAAIAEWTYDEGLAEWTAPRTWRPLPRRDATTRDDYDVVNAVNRHALTPWGWVHEQDNEKLELRGEPGVLVREIAYNTYHRYDDYNVAAADEYWAKTRDFWALVRAEWTRLEEEAAAFGLTIQGEPEELYMKILEQAAAVEKGEASVEAAAEQALAIIADYTTRDIGTLAERIEKRKTLDDEVASAE